MKPSSVVLVSLILISDIFASASGWKEKARERINLQPCNMYVKCYTAEYFSKEIDEAAIEACYLKLTKGKILGIPLRSQPKNYQGNILANEEHFSSHDKNYNHNTHILKSKDHPFLMWPLKNKFKHVPAKCYAIIKWSPDRVKCKAIGVIVRERGEDDVKCTQVTIRDPGSRYAGSTIYDPRSPSRQLPEGLRPFDDPDRRPSSVLGTTRVPPFNSNQKTTNDLSRARAPSFDFYQHNNEITELEN